MPTLLPTVTSPVREVALRRLRVYDLKSAPTSDLPRIRPVDGGARQGVGSTDGSAPLGFRREGPEEAVRRGHVFVTVTGEEDLVDGVQRPATGFPWLSPSGPPPSDRAIDMPARVSARGPRRTDHGDHS